MKQIWLPQKYRRVATRYILQQCTRAEDLFCGSYTPHSIPVLSQTSAAGFPLRFLLVPRVATLHGFILANKSSCKDSSFALLHLCWLTMPIMLGRGFSRWFLANCRRVPCHWTRQAIFCTGCVDPHFGPVHHSLQGVHSRAGPDAEGLEYNTISSAMPQHGAATKRGHAWGVSSPQAFRLCLHGSRSQSRTAPPGRSGPRTSRADQKATGRPASCASLPVGCTGRWLNPARFQISLRPSKLHGLPQFIWPAQEAAQPGVAACLSVQRLPLEHPLPADLIHGCAETHSASWPLRVAVSINQHVRGTDAHTHCCVRRPPPPCRPPSRRRLSSSASGLHSSAGLE